MMQQVAAKSNSNSDVTSLGTDDQNILINDLDSAQSKIYDILTKQDPLLLSYYFDLVLDGSREYYIPDNLPFNYSQIHVITDITDDSTTPISTMSSNWDDRMNYYDGDWVPVKLMWNLRDQYLEFPELPTGVTVRIWYSRRPVGFWYGTLTSGSTTTAVITTPTAGEIVLETDYYNGMWLVKGTQVRHITDFSFSGDVATFTVDAWSTAASTDVVSLISPLPSRYHQLIVDEAIRRQMVGNDDDDILVARLQREDIAIAQGNMNTRQRQGAGHIKNIVW